MYLHSVEITSILNPFTVSCRHQLCFCQQTLFVCMSTSDLSCRVVNCRKYFITLGNYKSCLKYLVQCNKFNRTYYSCFYMTEEDSFTSMHASKVKLFFAVTSCVPFMFPEHELLKCNCRSASFI